MPARATARYLNHRYPGQHGGRPMRRPAPQPDGQERRAGRRLSRRRGRIASGRCRWRGDRPVTLTISPDRMMLDIVSVIVADARPRAGVARSRPGRSDHSVVVALNDELTSRVAAAAMATMAAPGQAGIRSSRHTSGEACCSLRRRPTRRPVGRQFVSHSAPRPRAESRGYRCARLHARATISHG